MSCRVTLPWVLLAALSACDHGDVSEGQPLSTVESSGVLPVAESKFEAPRHQEPQPEKSANSLRPPSTPSEDEVLPVAKAGAAEQPPTNSRQNVPAASALDVREYATPGGPAGVAPVPDYPKRDNEAASASRPRGAPHTSVEVNQSNTIINNNNFYMSPFGFRDTRPGHSRQTSQQRRREQGNRVGLHPAVTTPVHPSVTTPVHP